MRMCVISEEQLAIIIEDAMHAGGLVPVEIMGERAREIAKERAARYMKVRE